MIVTTKPSTPLPRELERCLAGRSSGFSAAPYEENPKSWFSPYKRVLLIAAFWVLSASASKTLPDILREKPLADFYLRRQRRLLPSALAFWFYPEGHAIFVPNYRCGAAPVSHRNSLFRIKSYDFITPAMKGE